MSRFGPDEPPARPIVAVLGPTATGKSALAVALAQRLAGEVVNADAMALYRGMDIGTAKPTLAERRGIPHHQLDVLDVTEEASVAVYQRDARADLVDIATRGRTGVLAGGRASTSAPCSTGSTSRRPTPPCANGSKRTS